MSKDKLITAKEAVEELREELGMSITADTLRKGIAQGQFSFGSYIKTENSCVCYVYTRLLKKWIVERK